MEQEPRLMRWWRVELGKDGAIKSCEEVEETSKQGRHVRFVEAETKAEACSSAIRWVEAFRARRREEERRRLARYKSIGKCVSCGKPADAGTKCSACAKKQRERNKRLRVGVRVGTTVLSPEQALENRRKTANNSQRKNKDRVASVLGIRVTTNVVSRFKRLFDELGPEAFRAKLCEVVPDEPADRVAEAAE